MSNTFAQASRRASVGLGDACPVEAGLIGRLADNECRHGRLPTDTDEPCGCWPLIAATHNLLKLHNHRLAAVTA